MNWVSIDFGTSYSSATVLIDNQPEKVHPMGGLYNMYGFPTVAYVESPEKIMVCNAALPWRCKNPERFVKEFKLNIHEDEIAYLGVRYTNIIKEILKHIKISAEYAIGNDSIDGVILTIPATYTENDPRKQTMYDAATSAGFKEVKFIKEAEAAAIYYHSVQQSQVGSTTLIYDLGGGTFDPALVEHTPNGYRLLGFSSGIECGGKFFEAALYKFFKEKYSFAYSSDETIRVQQIDGIAKLCKEIKEALSSQNEVVFPVPLMKDVTFQVSRNQFEELIRPLLEKTFQECAALVANAGKQWKDIDRILLIGGSTAIPCVKSLLRSYLIGQNNEDIPIILNKSEEGLYIDTLFAVSIGGLLSHIAKDEPTSPPIHDNNDFFTLAKDLKDGKDGEKNWIKAAYFFNEDYVRNNREDSFNEMMVIYQTILDKLELENGSLIFQPIVPIVGEDAVDNLVELLILLQQDLESKGYEDFIKEIFDLDYWTPKTEKIIKRGIR